MKLDGSWLTQNCLHRVLPKDNDGGIYLYMTAFGGVARMNATPHKVTPDMSSSVRYCGLDTLVYLI